MNQNDYQVEATNCKLSGTNITIHRESDILTNEPKGKKIMITHYNNQLFEGTEEELCAKLLKP